MRRMLLPLLPLWALALAQTCSVRYTPPNYPELPFYREEGVWGSYNAPVFKPGIHGLPHVLRRSTEHSGRRMC